MRRIRIIIYLVVISFFSNFVQAQTIKHFSPDPSMTIEEASLFFRSASDAYKKDIDNMLKAFPEFWNQLSTNQQKVFIDIANVMLKNKMKPFPQFNNFVYTYSVFTQGKFSEKDFVNFTKCLVYHIENQNSKFTNILDNYVALITEHQFSTFAGAAWYARNCKSFTFEFDSVPKVIIPQLDLVAENGKDSLIIKKTSGVFFPATERFIGKGGIIDWQRAGLDPKKVYAEIKDYDIFLKAPSIEIENVIYHNPKYFNKPEKGRLEDKIVTIPFTPESATYPRFSSYNKKIRIDELYDDVDYVGGVDVRGSSFLGQGTPTDLATIEFKKKGKALIKSKALSYLLKEDQIESSLCNAVVLIGEDSIYHSAIRLKYTPSKKQMWLERGKDGSERMPFFNTYHCIEMYSEAMFWDMNTEAIDFTFIPGPRQSNTAIIESDNYFEFGRIDKFRGMSRTNPIYTLYEHFRKNRIRKTTFDAMVKDFNYARDDVRSLLFNFVEHGFIDYNVLTDEITYKPKLATYLLAEDGKKDYDIIQFNSTVSRQQTNAKLSLLNYDLTIYGLDFIMISDSQIVNVYPSGRQIIMQKNRDFLFSGKVEAGLFDFWVTNSQFYYDHFKMEFPVIDSIVFYVEDKRQAMNIMGEYPLQKVRSYIEDISGTLYIDMPNNKSSRVYYEEFPYFVSKSPGRVHYDHDFVHNGAYDRNRFYFYVDRFTAKSLDDFNTDSLLFNGYLNSGGIFPDIHKQLRVRPDFSLGFTYETEDNGLPAYGGKGTFTQKLDLSNKGLRGTGKLDYTQSYGNTKNMLFFLDSAVGTFDDYAINAQSIGAEYPPVTANNVTFDWKPYKDIMFIKNQRTPFRMYAEANLNGQLAVSPRGVQGSGAFRYRIAEMQSNEYDFLHHELKSSDLALNLRDTVLDDFYIKTVNHTAHVDFQKLKGTFTANGDAAPINFPINMFSTRSIEFDWMIAESQLIFKYDDPYAQADLVNTGLKDLYEMKSKGNELISTHPAQDSLQFTTTKATYDLRKYEIVAEGVRFIDVADAAIFPSNGIVKIFRRAEIGTLEKAKILANTDTKLHQLFDAKIDIGSRNTYNGSATYDYIDENKDRKKIFFDSLWVSRDRQSRGKGVVGSESDFALSPNFGFKGSVFWYAENRFLNFHGGINLVHSCEAEQYPAIRYKGDIDPEEIRIAINDSTRDVAGKKIVAAIASNPKSGSIYTAFARAKNPINSPEYISATGFLIYDKEIKSYIVATDDKLASLDKEGNAMFLDPQTCIARGEGKLDLGTNLGRVELVPIGNIINYLSGDSSLIQVAATLDFYFNDECMKMLSEYLDMSEGDVIDITENLNYQHALKELLGNEPFKRAYNELAQYQRFRRLPRPLQLPLLFSDLKLEWRQATKSFSCVGDIGVAVCGRREINKYVKGIVEIQKKSSRTSLQMYFEIGEEWFYFYYSGSSMQAFSSIKKFNDNIKNTPQEKRSLKAEGKKSSYSYRIGNVSAKNKFLHLYEWEMQSVGE